MAYFELRFAQWNLDYQSGVNCEIHDDLKQGHHCLYYFVILCVFLSVSTQFIGAYGYFLLSEPK